MDDERTDNHFTWRPMYRAVSKQLVSMEDRGAALLEILSEFDASGLMVIPLEDKPTEDTTGPLQELDPFTFFASFNRNLSDANRRAFLTALAKQWELNEGVPTDFDGLPIVNHNKTKFFPYKYERDPEHVPTLWEFFRHILPLQSPSDLNTELFDRCLQFKGVGVAYLTMGMFWVRPDLFAALDKKNLAQAKTMGVTAKTPTNGAEYLVWLDEVQNACGGDFCSFSSGAHDSFENPTSGKQLPAHPLNPESTGVDSEATTRNYWLIAPGQNAKFWQDWVVEGCARFGFLYQTSLADASSKKQLVDLVTEHRGEKGAKQIGKMGWDFARTMQPGDVVFAKKGRRQILGWGIVTSDYRFDEEASETRLMPHIRDVDWRQQQVADLPEGQLTAMKTLTRIVPGSDFLATLFEAYSGIPQPDEIVPVDVTSETRHYWLSANPSVWSPDDDGFGEGSTQDFSVLTDRGNPRKQPAAFDSAQCGDRVLVYITSPAALIWGEAEIVKSKQDTNGDSIHIRLTKKYPQAIARQRIKAHPQLSNLTPIALPQGTLFELSSNEFRMLQELQETDQTLAVEEFHKADALKDLFMPEEQLDSIMTLLRRKKNVILQGAPGTGKTFVARRLAYLLMGRKDEERAPMVQFHQSTSYEDFIQGFRPNEKGDFRLADGKFHQFCNRAKERPHEEFVFIIDEINRGNLSKVFGELMMLIEPDKRGPEFAIELSYSTSPEDKFFVPKNVYLIGTMNTADRSLSLVDYALRRRFSFVELEPRFAEPAFAEFLAASGALPELIESIVQRMTAVNEMIAKDVQNLGRGFQVGHSFFVPDQDTSPDQAWCDQIMEFEIRPLIEEYWIDNESKVKDALDLLREQL